LGLQRSERVLRYVSSVYEEDQDRQGRPFS